MSKSTINHITAQSPAVRLLKVSTLYMTLTGTELATILDGHSRKYFTDIKSRAVGVGDHLRKDVISLNASQDKEFISPSALVSHKNDSGNQETSRTVLE